MIALRLLSPNHKKFSSSFTWEIFTKKPQKGYDDFIGTFDSIEECKAWIAETSRVSGHYVVGSDSMDYREWYEILSSDFKLVSRGNIKADTGKVALEEIEIE